MSARVPPSILHADRLARFTGESAAARRVRVARAAREFVVSFAVQVVEVIGCGILLTLGAQLARPTVTFGAGSSFYRFLAGHATESEWATAALLVGALPVAGFLVDSKSLRWLALILEVEFFATWTFDAWRGGPAGVLWIYTLWLTLGCAMGAVRLAPGAYREARRRGASLRSAGRVRLFILRRRLRRRARANRDGGPE